MEIKADDGLLLLDLARKRIAAEFSRDENMQVSDRLQKLDEPRATFVTLKKNNQLRGCIGCLTAYEELYKNVATNAVNAAFHDSRFPQLSADELEDIHIELSILSPPEKLEYQNPNQLKMLLRPFIDGVILRYQGRSSTFLPQVWEQVPDVDQFLSHLCRKAGFKEDIWKEEHVDIETYQVQSFEEERT